MVSMRVIGLSIDTAAQTPIVLLQAAKGQELLPIWIGAMEAMTISLALSGKPFPRPLSHDLLINIMNTLGGILEGVEIHRFEDGVFYARIIVYQGEYKNTFDCRPSDAITMALKSGVPIIVSSDVLHQVAKAEQRQDAASFPSASALKEAEKTIDHVNITKEVEKHFPALVRKGTPQSHTKTTIEAPKDEEELTDLLKSMEPESSRRM